MKRTLLVIITGALLFFSGNTKAQRPMEKLDRSVIAQKVTNGVYVNWRITSDEWYNTSYKLYRDGILIHETGTEGASNFLDGSGTTTSVYTVAAVKNGKESAASASSSVITKGYIEIPMRDIKKLGKTGYYLNDCTAADLDGDGQYEVIVKRMNRDFSIANTKYTFFEAYKLDGTFLWAIDVGPNITNDVEINIAAFDFDGDNKAEVFLRTSDNTIFGDGKSVGDRDKDGVTNYRYSVGSDGFMNEGPEYLSLIDGKTGAELDWVNFIPRGNSDDWGKIGDGGHRANKFFFGAPYLDGEKPSIFIGRGIYTQTYMVTYDVVDKKLVKKWAWESGLSGSYYGQGNHNYTIADVDGDGCDEIVWGSMCVDHDGKGLYSTGLGHGDAMHVGDFDPYYKGIEVFACNEANSGLNMREGATGKILIRHVTASDCGRCGAGNISDDFKGAELWGGRVGYSATDRNQVAHFGVAENFSVYWDGDLLQELCDHSGFTSGAGVGYGQITKFNGYGNISSLLVADAYSCNYTKGTPCLQADLVGDWREEEIWWRSDSLALLIYITPYETEHRIYTLMHDHQYRQAIAWQMCGYNQPPHTSFYLGSDFPTPIPAKSTNGKLVWKGASSVWDATNANWMEGDSAFSLLAGTSNLIAFSNGKSVLFDKRGASKTIDIVSDISPELLMVSGSDSYKIGGTGSLSGTMHLDKLGEGSLTLSGTHNYSGTTDIWEGDMWMDGTLSASPVMVRRHANYGGTGTSANGISTEFNAAIYVGGKEVADTMTVKGRLNLAENAKLVFDLSDNPEIKAGTNVKTSTQKNDFLRMEGTLNFASGSLISINQLVDSLVQGDYLLAEVDSVTGNLKAVKIVGTIGVASSLVFDSIAGKLFLQVKGVRSAASIVWTGDKDSNWDMATTSNWNNNGFEDIFVANDSVYLKTEATNRTITLTDVLPVSYLEVNSGLDYNIDGDGSLTGPMSLYKTNNNTLTIGTRNSYTGKTIIDGGKLVMKYAPSSTDNGGIGTNNMDASYLVLKDSAILQVNTVNQITDRGLTLGGTDGGLLNVPVSLYWNGSIQGTKLTKTGSATLFIGSNNPSLNETVLNGGKIKLNSAASVQYGVGKKITVLNGTLETLNNTGYYLVSNNAFEVPKGYDATVIAGPRCEYKGALTGGGTLNWSCDFVRCFMEGDWSAFTGNLNITANSANSTSDNLFIVDNANGYPNAKINLGADVCMCYRNGDRDNNGTQTIKVGMLTGESESTFYNAGLEVGSNGESGTFGGIISGVTSVKKVGTGNWTISGACSYSGTTTISEGSVIFTGGKGGSGAVNAAAGTTLGVYGTMAGAVTLAGNSGALPGARLIGTGTLSGNVTVGKNAILSPADTTAIGTLTINGNLNIGQGIFEAQVSGGVTAKSDKLYVKGTITCGGTLNVTKLNYNMLQNGFSMQLFSANAITGKFSAINLPDLSDEYNKNLAWDTTALYSTGTISIVEKTGIERTTLKAGLMQNPTYGLFTVFLDKPVGKLTVSVTNLQGQILLHEKMNAENGHLTIDLRDHDDGFYMLKILADDRNYKILKLVKE